MTQFVYDESGKLLRSDEGTFPLDCVFGWSESVSPETGERRRWSSSHVLLYTDHEGNKHYVRETAERIG